MAQNIGGLMDATPSTNYFKFYYLASNITYTYHKHGNFHGADIFAVFVGIL